MSAPRAPVSRNDSGPPSGRLVAFSIVSVRLMAKVLRAVLRQSERILDAGASARKPFLGTKMVKGDHQADAHRRRPSDAAGRRTGTVGPSVPPDQPVARAIQVVGSSSLARGRRRHARRAWLASLGARDPSLRRLETGRRSCREGRLGSRAGCGSPRGRRRGAAAGRRRARPPRRACLCRRAVPRQGDADRRSCGSTPTSLRAVGKASNSERSVLNRSGTGIPVTRNVRKRSELRRGSALGTMPPTVSGPTMLTMPVRVDGRCGQIDRGHGGQVDHRRRDRDRGRRDRRSNSPAPRR